MLFGFENGAEFVNVLLKNETEGVKMQMFWLPLQASAVTLFADTLYQMGHFEHALVLYHRGVRYLLL